MALDAPLSFSFDRTLEQDERKQALLRAVERLPAQQKEVVTLKVWGELTFDEIARTLDESLKHVRLHATATPCKNSRTGYLRKWKAKKRTPPLSHE